MTDMLHHTNQDAQQALDELLADAIGNFRRHGNEFFVRMMLSERLRVILPSLVPAGGVRLVCPENKKQGGFVVHYTEMRHVVNMLRQVSRYKKHKKNDLGSVKDIPEPAFRMYHTEGFNDPSEGAVVNNLYRELSKKYEWFALPVKRGGAYVCSFVAAEKVGKHDELMFWRLYGDDGKGCSIKIVSHTVRSMLSLVQYRDKNEEHEDYDRIRIMLDTIHNATVGCQPVRDMCGDIVVSMLNPYRYYLKNNDYEYEKECRFVRAESEAKKVIPNTQNFPRIRCYINEGPKLTDIFSTDTVITVGPQAHTPYAAKAYIEKLLKDADLGGNIEVKVSQIRYRTP